MNPENTDNTEPRLTISQLFISAFITWGVSYLAGQIAGNACIKFFKQS